MGWARANLIGPEPLSVVPSSSIVRKWDFDRDVDRPAKADFSAAPWAVALLNGDKCVFATGTAEVVAGIRANYICSHGVALGLPDRSTRLWTIRYLSNDGAEARPTSIAKVWY